MYQIRKNVFETNSSSTHSICISKAPVDKKDMQTSIYFNLDDFGWQCGKADPANYLYTAIMVSRTDSQRYLDEIARVLDKYEIEYVFDAVRRGRYGIMNGDIDHWENLGRFIDDVVFNEDRLIRYLFGETCIFTGNDNCECDAAYRRCSVYYPTYYNYETHEELTNQYHDEEKYEYYYKGN